MSNMKEEQNNTANYRSRHHHHSRHHHSHHGHSHHDLPTPHPGEHLLEDQHQLQREKFKEVMPLAQEIYEPPNANPPIPIPDFL